MVSNWTVWLLFLMVFSSCLLHSRGVTAVWCELEREKINSEDDDLTAFHVFVDLSVHLLSLKMYTNMCIFSSHFDILCEIACPSDKFGWLQSMPPFYWTKQPWFFVFPQAIQSIHISATHKIHVWYITYIYHKKLPNVGKYTIDGSYQLWFKLWMVISFLARDRTEWPYSYLIVNVGKTTRFDLCPAVFEIEGPPVKTQ